MNADLGEERVHVEIEQQYRNMAEIVADYPQLIDAAKQAFEAAGRRGERHPHPGGTDGAQLSFRGLPCPTCHTGAYCCHGVNEFIPVSSLERMVDVLEQLVALFAAASPTAHIARPNTAKAGRRVDSTCGARPFHVAWDDDGRGVYENASRSNWLLLPSAEESVSPLTDAVPLDQSDASLLERSPTVAEASVVDPMVWGPWDSRSVHALIIAASSSSSATT